MSKGLRSSLMIASYIQFFRLENKKEQVLFTENLSCGVPMAGLEPAPCFQE